MCFYDCSLHLEAFLQNLLNTYRSKETSMNRENNVVDHLPSTITHTQPFLFHLCPYFGANFRCCIFPYVDISVHTSKKIKIL